MLVLRYINQTRQKLWKIEICTSPRFLKQNYHFFLRRQTAEEKNDKTGCPDFSVADCSKVIRSNATCKGRILSVVGGVALNPQP